MQSFYEHNRNPSKMCGYECIWIALVCKKSHLIKKYNLNNMEDLYMLLQYGNDNYPSLFEEKNVKIFYENCSQEIKNKIDHFKNNYFLKNETACYYSYYFLISIYFNIEIILHADKDKFKIDTYQMFYEIPEQFIHLKHTKGHVEYIPEYNEMTIYNQCKKNINTTKRMYEEYLCTEQLCELMKCNYFSDKEDQLFDDVIFSEYLMNLMN